MAKPTFDPLGISEAKKQFAAINKKLDEIISELKKPHPVHPELERAILEVSRRAISIDKKVPDQKPTKRK